MKIKYAFTHIEHNITIILDTLDTKSASKFFIKRFELANATASDLWWNESRGYITISHYPSELDYECEDDIRVDYVLTDDVNYYTLTPFISGTIESTDSKE